MCVLYVCVCLSVRSCISKTTRPNFNRSSVHVACGRGLVGGVAICHVLPVLWMMPRIHNGPRERKSRNYITDSNQV